MNNNQLVTYCIADELLQYEFGFLHCDGKIEVIVINHKTSQVRTLGYCISLTDAVFILETCIQYGFQEKGMTFKAVPGYQFNRSMEPMGV